MRCEHLALPLALLAACGGNKTAEVPATGASAASPPSASAPPPSTADAAAVQAQVSGAKAAGPVSPSSAAGGAPTDVNYEGTYRSGDNQIKLLKVDASHATFDVYAQLDTGNGGSNSGFATGGATVDKNGATYTAGPCTIRAMFAPGNKVTITQQGDPVDCGFGRGVVAAGTYTKVSSARPMMGIDPRLGGADPGPVPVARSASAPVKGKTGGGFNVDDYQCQSGWTLCAADNCAWCSPPGGGCDSPGACLNKGGGSTTSVKPASAPQALPKGATAKCAPGESGGVGYHCLSGYRYRNDDPTGHR